MQTGTVRPDFSAVRFYAGDASLAHLVGGFLAEGFAADHPALVVAAAAQRPAIIDDLARRGVDVAARQQANDLLLMDAHEMLATFMADGMPNPRKFREQMNEAIARLCYGRAGCTVRVFGQMVDVLWREGQRDAAMRLEVLLNQLAQTTAYSLIYWYSVGHFYKAANPVAHLTGKHSHS